MDPLVAAGVLAAILVAVIVRQVTFRGPPVWASFAAGAVATVALGVVGPGAATATLSANAPILLFLFALFVFAAALERAGALDRLARWIVGRARVPADLPLVLFVGVGLVSAVLVNDALVLVGVPMLLALARRLRTAPVPLLLTLAYAVTVGSVLTPLGNPQNLLVSLDSGLSSPILLFLRYLALPTAVNLLVGGWYLRTVFGPGLAAEQRAGGASAPPRIPLVPPGRFWTSARRAPVLVVFPATLVALVVADAASAGAGGSAPVPLYGVALAGALAVLLLTPGRGPLLRRVDWTILALFAGLFVVVAGAVAGGVLPLLERALHVPSPGDPAATIPWVVGAGLGGAQLVSNVPWVALQIPALHALGYGAGTPLAWVALAAGATLAGNVTLLGAASNLIVVQQAERAGVRIGLRAFVRHGLPLTAITVAVLVGCLWVGL